MMLLSASKVGYALIMHGLRFPAFQLWTAYIQTSARLGVMREHMDKKTNIILV
jgi:hypothetical protein